MYRNLLNLRYLDNFWIYLEVQRFSAIRCSSVMPDNVLNGFVWKSGTPNVDTFSSFSHPKRHNGGPSESILRPRRRRWKMVARGKCTTTATTTTTTTTTVAATVTATATASATTPLCGPADSETFSINCNTSNLEDQMPIVPRNCQNQILVDSWNITCDRYWPLLAHVCLVLRCCVMATFQLVKWCQIHHFHSFPSLSILYLIDNARYQNGMHCKVLSYFKERQHSMHPYHRSRLILLVHFIYLDLDQAGPNRINEGWSWRKHQTLPQTLGRGFRMNYFHFLNQHGSLVSCSNMAQLWVVPILGAC